MIQSTDHPLPFIFILGMHRSGTSCLAGALEQCGLFLGDVRRTGQYNAKGYFEIKEVAHLHDQILGLNRGTWFDPPEQVLVHPYHQQALKKIAARLSSRRPCGIKDPRMLLMLDDWLEIVPPPHALAGTFRHPMAVAESLNRRNGLPEQEGLALWLRYNTILVETHCKTPFPLVYFDLSESDLYCRTLAELAHMSGLKPNIARLRKFVDPALEHHQAGDTAIPVVCHDVWAYLMQHRHQPVS